MARSSYRPGPAYPLMTATRLPTDVLRLAEVVGGQTFSL